MLVDQRDLRRIVCSFSPYRVIACYAIFFVVRADCDTGNAAAGIIHDEILFSVLEEKSLTHEICDVVKCERVLIDDTVHQHHYPKDDFPIPGIEKEYESSEEAGSQEQLHDLYPSTRGDKTLQAEATPNEAPYDNILTPIRVFSLASNAVHNGACRKHSRIFLHQLKRYRMWALQMFDATAKLPSGILRGNVNQLGDFDECLSVDSGVVLAAGGERVRGKYCLASVDVDVALPATTAPADTDSLREAVELAQAYGFIRSKLADPGHFIPKFTSVNWALCVPASCQEEDVRGGVAAALRAFNGSSGLQLAVQVEAGMCYEQRAGRQLPGAALAVISVYVLVAVVAVVATVRDKDGRSPPRTAGTLERTVMAFSLRKNMAALLQAQQADGDIHCIDGIRTLSTVALYLAHKVITLALVPYANRVELTQVANEPLSSVLRASIVYTDTFLLLSGVLTAYHLTGEVQRKGSITWLRRYATRFVRLTPALVALVVFYAYVFEHVGHGPQWGRVVQQNADICKRNLWRNILYIQNFYPFQEMCATHTHQLALDMQLSLLAPPLVYLLHAHPVVGSLLLLALHVFSGTLRYLATLHGELSLVIYHGMPVAQLFKTANLMYSLSLHRATPYVMGVGLGYFIKKTGKKIHIPKAAVAAGWLGAVALAYYSLLSRSAEASRDFSYDARDASLYAAWSPLAWALALGWLIYACFTGYGGGVNSFLSCRPLAVLSRISYCVYLTQFVVFFYNVGTTRTSEQFTLLKAVDLGELVVVIILSIVATLLFDLPMQEIKGILIRSDARPIKAKETEENKTK